MLSFVGLLSCDERAVDAKCEFNKASTTSFPEGIGDGDCGVESLK